ncbi:MAG TPA: YgeY family selenium metabolism-linked hydrolase [Thermomicrobiales bacterium]|nr:YgeY family selenium metabolism-linked hydrolase [Thermomicrobiales bacterium]
MSEHDGVIELTRQLVAARSDAETGEQAAIDVARAAMVDLGFQDVTIDPLGNLTGSVPGSGGTGCLVFDGHADTVGVGDASNWASDPYAMEQRGTRLYGRGVSDMKGSIAAMIYGVARLKDDPIACDVVVSVSIAEELVEGHALGYVLDRYQPKAVVIGESTSMALARAQRGRAEVLVETFGVPAHSSTPQLGRNAIKPMAALVNLLSSLPMPSDALLGPAILEVTDIISHPYPALSVIPEHCMATFDRRMLVGETDEDVLAEVQAILDAYMQDDPSLDARASIAVDRFDTYTGYQVEAPNCAPAWRMADGAPIVQAGISALTQAGLLPILSHYAFCTNGSESAGRRNIPTVGFGPGDEAEAHRIDESIEVAHLLASVTGYEMLAREMAKL